ncbi:MAG: hypothetical protein ACOX6P_09830 [Candidatus Merdivicinus sp.]|jgi:hypothetical protein
MQSVSIQLSEQALGQLLATMPVGGHSLLPESEYSPKKFLSARRELEAAGLVELDFDGSLHPRPLLARMLWNLQKFESVMRIQAAGRTIYFIKGPVDLLQIRWDSEEVPWKMALRPLSEAEWMAKHCLYSEEEWEIVTQVGGEYPPLFTRVSAPRENLGEWEKIIREHLGKFYGKAAGKDAG